MPPLIVLAAAGCIVGVDPVTGAERFRHKIGHGPVALLVHRGRVFASSRDSSVHCFEYPSGEPRWRWQTSAQGRASLVVESEHLFVVKGGEVECFTLDGSRVWSAPCKLGLQGAASIAFPGNAMQADDDS